MGDVPEVKPLVAVVMGSDSDWNVMRDAAAALAEFDIPHEVEVVSAHRTPHRMIEFGTQAAGRGLRAIIAGAGGAAHLPGMLASVTTLPVIGVPVRFAAVDRADARRDSGRDRVDRGRAQRRAARGPHARRHRSGA